MIQVYYKETWWCEGIREGKRSADSIGNVLQVLKLSKAKEAAK